ncbi:MAG: hypothetical protein ACI8PZ_001000 [Myxococcota bacterium]|jgi:hypothetical protein
MRVLWVVLVPALVSGCVFKERTETESVEFTEPFERFTIDSDGGNVSLVGSATTKATGEITYRYDRARPEMVWSLQDDGELLVTVDCAYEDYLCEVELDVVIPSTTVTLIDTRIGDIYAENVVLTTTLDARNGSIEAVDIGGDLTAAAGQGDVSAIGLTGRRIQVTAEDGELTLDHDLSFDTIRADTGKGDVDVSVVDGRYNVVATATGGQVAITGLTADTSVDTRIEASTGDGNITITGKP